MRNRQFLFIVIIMIISLLAAACSPAADTAGAGDADTAGDPWGEYVFAPGDEIKVGLSSALTGGYAAYGEDMLHGVELAVEDMGDIQGWALVAEGRDDGCEGAPGVTVAELFVADPSVIGVIGPMCSGSVVPASDIYAEHNMVMVTPSSTAVVVTARGYENLFRTIANDDLQATVAVDYISGELGLTTLAVMHDQSIYGEGLGEAVASKFEAAGGTVTTIQGITRGDTDFSAVISTVMADDPAAVYWGGMDAEAALIVNQLRSAGFEGVFFGPDGIKSKPVFVDGSGGAAEGAYFTFGAVGGATGYDEWETRFTEKYGEPIAYGPGSYDAATVLLNAAASVATVDADGNLVIGKKALADAMRETPYDGITGHMEFTDTGDLGVVSITLSQVVDSDFVEIKTVDFTN
ncbi:MAG: branched-chain amino acid ABC transporter substrate-binding protein [Anaerolineales bacterium]|nr:branched-chain amino acid ABC transporter substrate-binding protein [Anaerolineales bacterium]